MYSLLWNVAVRFLITVVMSLETLENEIKRFSQWRITGQGKHGFLVPV